MIAQREKAAFGRTPTAAGGRRSPVRKCKLSIFNLCIFNEISSVLALTATFTWTRFPLPRSICWAAWI